MSPEMKIEKKVNLLRKGSCNIYLKLISFFERNLQFFFKNIEIFSDHEELETRFVRFSSMNCPNNRYKTNS